MSTKIKSLLSANQDDSILDGLNQVTKDNFLGLFSNILPLINSPKNQISQAAIKTASSSIKLILSNREEFELTKTKRGLANILLKLNPQILSEISEQFNDEDLDKKFDALYIMRSLNNAKEAAQLLMDALKENNQIVRACAVKTLGRLATLKDVSIITRFLKDSDGRVRANAVEALDEMNKKDNMAILLRLRNDTNNRVKGNVLKALYLSGYKNILPDLEKMLTSKSELMRASACWTIGEIGEDNEAIFLSLLDMLSDDKSKLVQTNILRSRAKIRGLEEEVAANGGPFLTKGEKELREKIISSSNVSLGIEKTAFFTVIKLEGNLNVYSMVPLKMRIKELLDSDLYNIALNFKKVSEVDQTVINFLSNLNNKIRTLEGKFMIFNVSSDVSDIFHFGNLDGRVLTFLQSEDVSGILN